MDTPQEQDQPPGSSRVGFASSPTPSTTAAQEAASQTTIGEDVNARSQDTSFFDDLEDDLAAELGLDNHDPLYAQEYATASGADSLEQLDWLDEDYTDETTEEAVATADPKLDISLRKVSATPVELDDDDDEALSASESNTAADIEDTNLGAAEASTLTGAHAAPVVGPSEECSAPEANATVDEEGSAGVSYAADSYEYYAVDSIEKAVAPDGAATSTEDQASALYQEQHPPGAITQLHYAVDSGPAIPHAVAQTVSDWPEALSFVTDEQSQLSFASEYLPPNHVDQGRFIAATDYANGVVEAVESRAGGTAGVFATSNDSRQSRDLRSLFGSAPSTSVDPSLSFFSSPPESPQTSPADASQGLVSSPFKQTEPPQPGTENKLAHVADPSTADVFAHATTDEQTSSWYAENASGYLDNDYASYDQGLSNGYDQHWQSNGHDQADYTSGQQLQQEGAEPTASISGQAAQHSQEVVKDVPNYTHHTKQNGPAAAPVTTEDDFWERLGHHAGESDTVNLHSQQSHGATAREYQQYSAEYASTVAYESTEATGPPDQIRDSSANIIQHQPGDQVPGTAAQEEPYSAGDYQHWQGSQGWDACADSAQHWQQQQEQSSQQQDWSQQQGWPTQDHSSVGYYQQYDYQAYYQQHEAQGFQEPVQASANWQQQADQQSYYSQQTDGNYYADGEYARSSANWSYEQPSTSYSSEGYQAQQHETSWQANVNQGAYSAAGVHHGQHMAYSQSNTYYEGQHSRQQPSVFTPQIMSTPYFNHSLPVDNGYHYTQASYQQPEQSWEAPVYQPPKNNDEGCRSVDGRPPYPLFCFGFGGAVVTMVPRSPVQLTATHANSEDYTSDTASSERWVLSPLRVQRLADVLSANRDDSEGDRWVSAVLRMPGPLSFGALSKDGLAKFIEDRASRCNNEESRSTRPAALRMLYLFLRLLWKHYGKLRSIGIKGDSADDQQGGDGAEAAIAELLASHAAESAWAGVDVQPASVLQRVPTEFELQITAASVQKLLVAGKRKAALQAAVEGQLWGTALILARHLGDKVFADTCAEVATRSFCPGVPMQTLHFLLAGRPADIFQADGQHHTSGSIHAGQQHSGPSAFGGFQPASSPGNNMLGNWHEHLAIMAANRTPGDDAVILHLGDRLWGVLGEVEAAHLCYLVAERPPEQFNPTARMCLIGADHKSSPRTYATPEAIMRTEIFEHALAAGNSQFVLLPLQPYKVLYAHWLAECGKPVEALKYCDSVNRALRSASRNSVDVDVCRQAAAALEERLRSSVQGLGGFAIGGASRKLLGGLFRAVDRGINRLIGGGEAEAQGDGGQAPRDSGRPPTKTSSEPDVRLARHKRSASEPVENFEDYDSVRAGAESAPTSSPKASRLAEVSTDSSQGSIMRTFSNAVMSGLSLVAAKKKNEVKLGASNRFYYDENLKCWREEGVDEVPNMAPPPPPPTSVSYGSNAGQHTPTEAGTSFETVATSSPTPVSLGLPPLAGGGNQFSARARTGVRSRYVDTFNAGAAKPQAASTTPSAGIARPLMPPRPSAPAAKVNFFVPSTAAAPVSHTNSSINQATDDAPSSTNLQSEFSNTHGAAAGNSLYGGNNDGATAHQGFQNPWLGGGDEVSSTLMSVPEDVPDQHLRASAPAGHVDQHLHFKPSHPPSVAADKWGSGMDIAAGSISDVSNLHTTDPLLNGSHIPPTVTAEGVAFRVEGEAGLVTTEGSAAVSQEFEEVQL